MVDLDAFIFILLVLTIAGYVLLALFLLAHALTAFVSQRRPAERSVKRRAQANRRDPTGKVVFESGVQGIVNGGRKVHSWVPARVSTRAPREPAA